MPCNFQTCCLHLRLVQYNLQNKALHLCGCIKIIHAILVLYLLKHSMLNAKYYNNSEVFMMHTRYTTYWENHSSRALETISSFC